MGGGEKQRKVTALTTRAQHHLVCNVILCRLNKIILIIIFHVSRPKFKLF